MTPRRSQADGIFKLTAGTPLDLVDDLPIVPLGRQQVHALYEPLERVFDLVGVLTLLAPAALLELWCTWRIRRTSPGRALFTPMTIRR